MKRLLFLFTFIVIIASYSNTNAKALSSFIVTTPEGDEMKFSVINEDNNTVKLIYYIIPSECRNDREILNIPAEVCYDGITYSVTTISSDAYSKGGYGYNRLKLNIPNGIKYIEEKAFKYCEFAEINLPSTLLEIKEEAFLEPGVTWIDLPPMSGSSGEIEHYNDVASPLIISNYVEKISKSAFANNNFLTVTMGQSVNEIELWAFSEIDNLLCCAPTPPVLDFEIDKNGYVSPCISCINKTKLLVPPGCKEIYEQNENWSKVRSIGEYEYYVDAKFREGVEGKILNGDTRELHPKITWLHEGSSERYRYWSSSDENVATVDQNGVITAKNFGEATITLMIEDERGVPFNCNYDVLVTTSADVDILESDDTDTTVEVFTLNGVKVGDTSDNLPAGFYIVKSAKEVKKVCIK